MLMSLPQAHADNFEDTEIRVIRPRYFNKSKRLELGAQLTTVTNETFTYSFLATGLAAFHINEEWALQGSGSYGLSVDKDDKRRLEDSFDIKTFIFRTQYNADLSVQYTPMYGKWQLSSGKLVYFDTFFSSGFGITGIDWRYSDFCEDQSLDATRRVRADQVKSYPTFNAGIGQRYFMSRSMAYRLDIRFYRFQYDPIDTECDESVVEQGVSLEPEASHNILTVQLGASYYF